MPTTPFTGPKAPKSIPIYEAIATLLDLNNIGDATGATDQGAAVFDLQDGGDYPFHEGLAVIEVKTTNGQGGTPTSPGSGKVVTVHYAFSNESIALADAPTVLQNVDATLACTLPDSALTTAAGQRYHRTDPFVIGGRYIYVWYDFVAFGSANSKFDAVVKLLRC